jgi:hypothetical protein
MAGFVEREPVEVNVRLLGGAEQFFETVDQGLAVKKKHDGRLAHDGR